MNAERRTQNAECRMNGRQQTTSHSLLTTRYSALTALYAFCMRSAFTLIEMLTVIAIIGILAGILLPAVRLAQRVARKRVASAGIRNLQIALDQYQLDFGAYPPDNNIGDWLSSPGVDFSDINTPNECMMWFLTREYTPANDAKGQPWDTDTWSPKTASIVFARQAVGPYFNVDAKHKRDDDHDGFPEYVDSWTRPYLYKAYLSDTVDDSVAGWHSIDKIEADGKVTLANSLYLTRIQGQVRLRNCANSSNNGTFTFIGNADDVLTLSGGGGAAEDPCPGQARFPLHNSGGCDIYSLGPNGLTRGALRPTGTGSDYEWKPWGTSAEFDKWSSVWGTPGDGNDDGTPSGNVSITDKEQDDLNNW